MEELLVLQDQYVIALKILLCYLKTNVLRQLNTFIPCKDYTRQCLVSNRRLSGAYPHYLWYSAFCNILLPQNCFKRHQCTQ